MPTILGCVFQGLQFSAAGAASNQQSRRRPSVISAVAAANIMVFSIICNFVSESIKLIVNDIRVLFRLISFSF
jgi:hypothetical protein